MVIIVRCSQMVYQTTLYVYLDTARGLENRQPNTSVGLVTPKHVIAKKG